MATKHTLLTMGARTAIETEAAVPLAERTRLTATLTTAAVTGSLSVVIEASATGDDAAYDVLYTFTVVAPGVVTKTSVGNVDFTVQPWHKFLRARVSAITTATAELTCVAPWIDTTADAALFSKELRSFGDGYARIVSDAEEVVMAELLPRVNSMMTSTYPEGLLSPFGDFHPPIINYRTQQEAELLAGTPHTLTLDADASLAGFYTTVRIAIVRQAEHTFQRYKLTQRDDAPALVSLRQFPRIAPNLMQDLGRFRSESSTVWRGR